MPTLGTVTRELDRNRKRARDRARNADTPDERAAWEHVADDLDGAAALVRRAVATDPGRIT